MRGSSVTERDRQGPYLPRETEVNLDHIWVMCIDRKDRVTQDQCKLGTVGSVPQGDKTRYEGSS